MSGRNNGRSPGRGRGRGRTGGRGRGRTGGRGRGCDRSVINQSNFKGAIEKMNGYILQALPRQTTQRLILIVRWKN